MRVRNHDKHVVEILPEYIYYMFKYRNWDEGSNKAVMGKTLNKATLKESAKHGGCGECQTSCQSACKTSCTVANQKCERV